jgi:hypothetical protein
MISDKDYVFVERGENETSYVKLVAENEWNGTIFQYGNLSVRVDEESDMAHLDFSYTIVESPLNEDMLNVDEGFKNYIGEVLQYIITSALDNGEYKLGLKDSDNDPTKSD